MPILFFNCQNLALFKKNVPCHQSCNSYFTPLFINIQPQFLLGSSAPNSLEKHQNSHLHSFLIRKIIPAAGGALRQQLFGAARRAAHEQPARPGGGDEAGVRHQGAGRRRRPRQEGRREHPRGAHSTGKPGGCWKPCRTQIVPAGHINVPIDQTTCIM